MNEWLSATLGLLVGLGVAYATWRRSRQTLARVQRAQLQLTHARDAEAQRVAQSEARLDAVGLAVLEVILIVDADLAVLYATPGARALFSAGDDAIGRSLIEFTRSAELDQLAADALAYGRAASGTRDELDRIIPIAGRPFRVRAAAFPAGAVLALSDVSELQRLGRARRDFVANISHELRTPLTSIRLVLENLLGGTRDPHDVDAGLRRIQVEVETLQQMAQELLDLSQIESGRTPVRLVPTALAPLVTETAQRFLPQARRKRQNVQVDVAPDVSALADAELVGRALGNLLHNAIKFTSDGGQIRVRAFPLAGDVCIEVADTGPGIPPEDLLRVFERFFQSDRSRVGGGTGLGLAIAKHLVEAHGGHIWAENVPPPEHGAILRFTLPPGDAAG